MEKAFIWFDERPGLENSRPSLLKRQAVLLHQKTQHHCWCPTHLVQKKEMEGRNMGEESHPGVAVDKSCVASLFTFRQER